LRDWISFQPLVMSYRITAQKCWLSSFMTPDELHQCDVFELAMPMTLWLVNCQLVPV